MYVNNIPLLESIIIEELLRLNVPKEDAEIFAKTVSLRVTKEVLGQYSLNNIRLIQEVANNPPSNTRLN